eukprot:1306431-Rhodomonas_salina.1
MVSLARPRGLAPLASRDVARPLHLRARAQVSDRRAGARSQGRHGPVAGSGAWAVDGGAGQQRAVHDGRDRGAAAGRVHAVHGRAHLPRAVGVRPRGMRVRVPEQARRDAALVRVRAHHPALHGQQARPGDAPLAGARAPVPGPDRLHALRRRAARALQAHVAAPSRRGHRRL